MKNHFIFSYFGNKRSEVDIIYNIIKDTLNDIDTIVEPFCGSSAMSFYISTQHPKKFKYILNDNNKILMDIYHLMKDPEKLKIVIENLNKINANIFKLPTPEKRKEQYDIIKK